MKSGFSRLKRNKFNPKKSERGLQNQHIALSKACILSVMKLGVSKFKIQSSYEVQNKRKD